MTNHPNRNKRYAGCVPTVLCGRRVWIAERGVYGSKEIWVHADPTRRAVAYFRGSSLTEGTETENRKFLEILVCKNLASLPPITAHVNKLWEEEAADGSGSSSH